MKKLSLLILSILAFSLCHAQPVRMELNLTKGKVYSYDMSSKSMSSQEILGQKIDIDMNMLFIISFVVKEVHETYYDFDVKYEYLKLEAGNIMEKMVVDSKKNDPQDAMSSLLTEMTQHSFQMKMNKQGEVIGVSGLDKLYEAMTQHAQQLPEIQKQQMISQLSQSFGEEALKGNLGLYSAIFSKETVAPGDTWTQEHPLNTGYTQEKIKITYTYKGIQENCWVIETKGEFSTQGGESFIEIQPGMQAMVELQATTSSVLKIDRATGWLMKSDGDMPMTGKMTIKDTPLAPEGMVIPVNTKTTFMVIGDIK